MEVILLERVENLGSIGDTVSVKAGFARNFLLPSGKALRATTKNLKIFEAQRADIEARNEEAKTAAGTEAEKLDGTSYILIRQASDMGMLYGSVSSRDIAAAIEEAGFTVTRNQVILDKPLKALGLEKVRVQLHPEVSVWVEVNVARSQEEAEAQSRGENVLGRTDDLDDEDKIVGTGDQDIYDDAPEEAEAASEEKTEEEQTA